ncbi:AEC family transporter [Pseudooceanicola atlanticus]|uniref:Transporter n=1 Tax=Pseudooceanicola atlanticus TaxID=1461694 RepID=A0A0A0EFZ4_9RHOB|nr:AEC family transporter [Pseudooceanicola atlanticus]KGM49841.1 transporter [Pseudooceanicola atlanticus]
MNLAFTVLEIVAPVFILAAIGFGWVKAGFEYRVEFVTRLAMTLSVPCLIFVSLMRTNIDPSALTALSLASVVAYGVLTVVVAVGLKVFGYDQRTYQAPLIFGNTGNLGLPLALFAFGETGLGYAVVVFAVMAIWSFTYGIWIVSGGGSVMKAVKEPLVWGTVLGGIFLWQGWETPRFLTNTLELIGQMAIPIMLITLGVAVARLTPGRMAVAVVMAVVKVIVCVAIAWGVGVFFKLDDTAFAVLVLQIATPVAVTSYLLAEKYGADGQAVAGLVVVSTLLSVVAIPLILAVLL